MRRMLVSDRIIRNIKVAPQEGTDSPIDNYGDVANELQQTFESRYSTTR